MTACRTNAARRFAVGAGLLATIALAGAAAAQTRGPILLGPPPSSSSGGDSTESRPLAPQVPALPPPLRPTVDPSAPRTTADGAIRIEGLTRLTADAAGTLTAESGGLRSDLWAGTPGPIALRLVALLPAAPDSHALRGLQRRLLLSSSRAPDDLPAEGALLAARARLLLAMGAVDDLAALAVVAPGRDRDPVLARVLAEGAMAAGDDSAACGLVDAMATGADDRFWIRAAVVCDLARGDNAKAEFGVRLLGELGEPDELLQDLVQGAVAGRAGGPEPMAGAEPLHLAAARAARAPVDPDVTRIESLPVLVALARGVGGTSFTARLAAAEKAERAGALAAETLTALYAEMAIRPGAADGALQFADAEPGPYARALLWRTAETHDDPGQRAALIAKAFEIAEDAATWRQTARVFAPLIRSLAAGPATDSLAADAVRALVVAGEAAAARPWVDRLRAVGGTEGRRVWPVAWIGGGDGLVAYDEAAVSAWWGDLRDVDPDGASVLGGAALSLMAALGAPVGVDAWRGLTGLPPTVPYEVPSAGFRNGVTAAAEAGRLAESILLAGAGFGDVPLGDLDPTAVAGVVAALVRLGLAEDGRRLAAEAAVAYGL